MVFGFDGSVQLIAFEFQLEPYRWRSTRECGGDRAGLAICEQLGESGGVVFVRAKRPELGVRVMCARRLAANRPGPGEMHILPGGALTED